MNIFHICYKNVCAQNNQFQICIHFPKMDVIVYYVLLYDKRDDFNFHITNFPFLSSNIPSSLAYDVFISQLIQYTSACSSYACFILRALRLSYKVLEQRYVLDLLKSSLMKFYGRYGDLIKYYEVVPLQNDVWHFWIWPCAVTSSINQDFHWIVILWRYYWLWPYYQIQVWFRRTFATGAASQQRTPTPPDTWSFPICSIVETILSCACHVSGLWISNISRYFFFFAS